MRVLSARRCAPACACATLPRRLRRFSAVSALARRPSRREDAASPAPACACAARPRRASVAFKPSTSSLLNSNSQTLYESLNSNSLQFKLSTRVLSFCITRICHGVYVAFKLPTKVWIQTLLRDFFHPSSRARLRRGVAPSLLEQLISSKAAGNAHLSWRA